MVVFNKHYSDTDTSKEIKEIEDRKLSLKNKTEFYFHTRQKNLSRHHVINNELNLTTFLDKLNWLIIHQSPEYKSFIVDKIKFHDYSKKILGIDICVPIKS